MREVIEGAAAESPEVIVAALERAEVGQIAEVPFAEQGGAVAGFLEERGQRGMLGRQAQSGVAGAQRLVEADGQAVLIAAGDQRGPRGRAHGRVGVGLQELHALGGEAVDVGRVVIAAAVAGEVGVARSSAMM